jgi:uncharacterized membrane protein
VRTRSQRWADVVTEFSGSWPFILWFTALCIVWIGTNSLGWVRFDPYPFLFLNWTLTVVSTMQNPIILLSQNRQNENDRTKTDQIMARLEALQEALNGMRADALEQKHLDKTNVLR